MIIALAQGLAKATAIVTEILGCQTQAIEILNDALSYPITPVGNANIAVTYFPMGSVFSIACDTFAQTIADTIGEPYAYATPATEK